MSPYFLWYTFHTMKKGFTLIELLVVVGILAILAVAVVLVINPTQILAQGRDTQRLNDLKTMKNAIAFYLTRSSAPSLNGQVNATFCTATTTAITHAWRASADYPPGTGGQIPALAQPFTNPNPAANAVWPGTTNLRKIDGTGWAAVMLDRIANSAISKLPVDPVNRADNDLADLLFPPAKGLFYAYQCKGLSYEINANMESIKYANGGDKDVESKDGGTNACLGGVCSQAIADVIYEVGNDPGLDL